jgi:hypothetical protein
VWLLIAIAAILTASLLMVVGGTSDDTCMRRLAVEAGQISGRTGQLGVDLAARDCLGIDGPNKDEARGS